MEDFYKPKIVYGQFQDGAEYSFAESGVMVSSNEYILKCNNYSEKCLLAFLNCKTIEWLLSKTTGNLSGNAKIGQKSNFIKLSIPILNENKQKEYSDLVDKIIENMHQNETIMSEYEDKINKKVYTLYNLTNEEITEIERL